jgi:hypothetical protein
MGHWGIAVPFGVWNLEDFWMKIGDWEIVETGSL